MEKSTLRTSASECPDTIKADVNATIALLKKGYPISIFERLKERMHLPEKELANVVNISHRTLARRKKDGRLQTDESERILRIERLFDRAVEVLGNDVSAIDWFQKPNVALGNVPPLQFADTEPGAREVEDLLGRLENGVFS